MHLPAYPYGPDMALDGASATEIIATEERIRLPPISTLVSHLDRSSAIPTFVLGDFNSPSHLDWTTETVGTRPQIKFPIAWPVTTALSVNGFNDSYRAMHPLPLQRAGITWWANETTPRDPTWPSEADPSDRIDYVFSRNATLESCQVVGEIDGPDVEIEVTPWSSDHRAVVAEFKVLPADLTPWVSVPHAYVVQGTTVFVRYALVRHSSAFVLVLSESSHEEMARSLHLLDQGIYEVTTHGWPPGDYVVLLESTNQVPMRRTRFSLFPPKTPPQIEVNCATCTVEHVVVRWVAAPGNRFDWVGFYDVNTKAMKTWKYTQAKVDGTWTLSPAEAEKLVGGVFIVRLLLDNTYTVLSETRELRIFKSASNETVAPSPPPPPVPTRTETISSSSSSISSSASLSSSSSSTTVPKRHTPRK